MFTSIWAKLGIGLFTLLAIGAAIFGIVHWYNNQLDAAFGRGEAAAYARVEHKAVTVAGKLTAAAIKLKDKANEEHLNTAVAATDFRVRGPGRASCPAPVDTVASGHEQALTPEADAGLAVSPEQWARVPWNWLVTVIQEHDDLLTEATAQRAQDQAEKEILAEESK